MECPKCKKGFVTNQILYKDEREYLNGKNIVRTYKINYDFCSNVLCNWSNRVSTLDFSPFEIKN